MKGDEYSSKYIEELRKAQKDTEEQYKKYMAQKEKEEEEKMRKEDEPYKGMKEKYINITLMGRAKEKRTEHYTLPGKKDSGTDICGITAMEQKNSWQSAETDGSTV